MSSQTQAAKLFNNSLIKYYDNGEAKEAIKCLNEAKSKLNSLDSSQLMHEIYVELAAAHLFLGNQQEALDCVDQAFKDASGSASAYYASAYYVNAQIAQSLGQPEKALKEYEQGNKLLEANTSMHQAQVLKTDKYKLTNDRITMHQADALLSIGRTEEALKLYNELKFPIRHYKQGLCLTETDPTKALKCHSTMLKVSKNFAFSHYEQGNILAKLARYAEAEISYSKAIGLGQNSWLIHHKRGNVLYQLGKFDEALESYNHALKLDKHAALTHCQMAQIFMLSNRNEEALSHFDSALKENSNTLTESKVHYINQAAQSAQAQQVEQSSQEEVMNLSTSCTKLLKLKQSKINNLLAPCKTTTDDNEIAQDIIKYLNKPSSNNDELTEIKLIVKKLYEMLIANEQKVNYHHKTLENTGAFTQSEINQELIKLSHEPVLYCYCLSFRHTLSNLFKAYRVLNTKLVSPNFDGHDQPFFQLALQYGLKYAAAAAQGFLVAAPLVNTLKNIVEDVYKTMQKTKFSNITAALDAILQTKCNFIQEETLSSRIALKVTEERKLDILAFDQQNMDQNLYNKIYEKLDTFNKKLGGVGEYLYLSPQQGHFSNIAIAAVRDATNMLNQLIKHSKEVISSQNSLEDECVNIMRYLLKMEAEIKVKKSKSCCFRFPFLTFSKTEVKNNIGPYYIDSKYNFEPGYHEEPVPEVLGQDAKIKMTY